MAQGLFVILRDWITCFSAIWDIVYFPGRELPIMALAWGSAQKGLPFSGLRFMKGEGIHELRYMRG